MSLSSEKNGPPDIEALRLSGESLAPKRAKRRITGWFIRGPIPGDWIARAAVLPGKSLHVALAVCYLAGLRRPEGIRLCPRTLAKFGVSAKTGRAALAHLEAAGLVEVDRGRGRCPRVTVLDCAGKQDAVS